MKQTVQNLRFYIISFSLVAVWIMTTAMHIPDGYLSPVTDLILLLLVLPFWIRGVQRLRQTANARNVPVIALFAALCFVIMMFNVPLPGGTTGHAVGGALAAIVLGPEVATIAITVALVIQAFFFGDGGILALGANCFNMAVVLPYVSYSIYHFALKNLNIQPRWRVAAAGLSGWAGLTLAALFAGIEFGIQPILFHTTDGTPLYAPYPLSISIPAMVIPHALVVSVVEGVFTALVVAYLMRSNKTALEFSNNPLEFVASSGWMRIRGYVIALSLLAVATPLGLLAPGTAWGEWGSKQLTERGLSFIPRGLVAMENLWTAPLSGYNLPALRNSTFGYLLSAVLGIFLVGFFVWLFTALFTLNRPSEKVKDDIQ
jgi:cobalt/nickel transport system permease protein